MRKAAFASKVFGDWACGNVQDRFTKCLHSLWQQTGSRPRLGLAISGGVDSMALASLCSTARRMDRDLPRFTGFIVDHGLRDGSTDEAKSVAKELEKLDIEPSILTLDRAWLHSDDKIHIETTARTLRYQALGRACWNSGIRGLLVGHHAGDQAETVLQRLILRFYGNGLIGMQPFARIPECSGIYGVHESGEPIRSSGEDGRAMLIEDGGVMLGRPLLGLAKHELKILCQTRSVSWVEDATNLDARYGLRNAVRHLQRQGDLPKALGTARLCDLAHIKGLEAERCEATAHQLLQNTELELDLRTDKLTFKSPFPPKSYLGPRQIDLHVQVAYIKRLCDLLGSSSTISVDGSIHDAVDMIFSQTKSGRNDFVHIAGLRLQRISKDEFVLKHTPPNSRHAARRTLHLAWTKCDSNMKESGDGTGSQPTWKTNWHLWDDRFWVESSCSSDKKPSDEYYIQHLTKEHIRRYREDVSMANDKSSEEKGRRLKTALEAAPGDLRWTLPAIVRGEEDAQKLVALPSLGWSTSGVRSVHEDDDGAPEIVKWEIRHRRLGLEPSERHTFRF